MDVKPNGKIVAVVPAFNEADRIHDVLEVLVSMSDFSEIVVVDDGSSDGTADAAAKFPVRVVRLDKNVGKAQAMEEGVRVSDAEFFFFCDADMKGLTPHIIREVLNPVRSGKAEMMLAIHDRTIYYLSFILSVIPLLSGQRALTRKLWDRVPKHYKQGFKIEGALNFYARYWGSGYRFKVFGELGQVIKEKKYGILAGLKARSRMLAEICILYAQLHLHEVPSTVRSLRLAAVNVAWASAGALFGFIVLVASYTGPATFVREVFADDIQSESSTPFIDLMLYVATNAGVDLIATAGVLILAFNMMVAVINITHVRYLRQFVPARPQRMQ